MSSASPALPPRSVLYVRSAAYLLFQIVTVLLFATLGVVVAMALPFKTRYRLLTTWGDINVWFLARVCKLDYRVDGLDRVPNKPCIIMANHQSAWETLALQRFFPPIAWILKRELLWIPFFGWGLALIEPVALDRKARRRALDQLVETGKKRLRAGRWIMVFPQGTRVPPGETGHYKIGGAALATKTETPVVPVAHNAGRYWGRRQFLKHPGTIQVVIGEPIEAEGKAPATLLREVREWIERHRIEIGG